MTSLAVRSKVTLTADPTRVLARLFVPGHELVVTEESRATGVLGRILALDDDVVDSTLRDVRTNYDGRHRDLSAILRAHFERIEHRIPDGPQMSEERRQLIGACFTNEFTVEGAALFNPSVVAHPDQSALADGELRILLSLRAVGEGHISCVEFRTGVVGPGQELRIDTPGGHLESGSTLPTHYDKTLFAILLGELGAGEESTRYLLGRLTDQFDSISLDDALMALTGQRETRQGGDHTAELARRIAACSYEVEFSPLTTIDERVLWPYAPSESHGMEDARFVRFVADDGVSSYLGTYTAFDGVNIAPQLIETDDFRSFRISQLAGPAAKNKGMALFPRKVGGRHVALTRWDRENNSLTTSDDGRFWEEAQILQAPTHPWELIQKGNCGSPVETEAGWLVLTHGVGPMREYTIGAVLLDLEDPLRVIGSLPEPLLRPEPDERNGYVPNVLYSCGALLQEDQLLLPYGASDAFVGFAFVDVPALLDRLTDEPSATMSTKSSA